MVASGSSFFARFLPVQFFQFRQELLYWDPLLNSRILLQVRRGEFPAQLVVDRLKLGIPLLPLWCWFPLLALGHGRLLCPGSVELYHERAAQAPTETGSY